MYHSIVVIMALLQSPTPKIILIDVDNTVADLETQFVKFFREKWVVVPFSRVHINLPLTLIRNFLFFSAYRCYTHSKKKILSFLRILWENSYRKKTFPFGDGHFIPWKTKKNIFYLLLCKKKRFSHRQHFWFAKEKNKNTAFGDRKTLKRQAQTVWVWKKLFRLIKINSLSGKKNFVRYIGKKEVFSSFVRHLYSKRSEAEGRRPKTERSLGNWVVKRREQKKVLDETRYHYHFASPPPPSPYSVLCKFD